MNRKGETGWHLASIPTRMHNDDLVSIVNSRFPGVKSDDKFNLLWIGLGDPEKSNRFDWNHGYLDVNYFNYTRKTGSGRYGLLNKNDGGWTLKSSLTFKARGLCSRARTCWDISSAVQRGKMTLSTDDMDNLIEGTTAKVTCDKKCKLKGAAKLTCIGGLWNGNDIMPTCECKKKKDKKNKDKKNKGGKRKMFALVKDRQNMI
jgi:hypothetical protein